jgi:hypothetical protein
LLKIGFWGREGWEMGPKKKGKAALALVVFLLLPAVSHALTIDQKALVGLKGVHVLVEAISPEVERIGLTRNQLQTDVELRLRKAGVRVLTQKECFETPGMPYLYVLIHIGFIKHLDGYIFATTVSLKQTVRLAGGGQTIGSIWEGRGLGFVGPEKIGQIRGMINDRVDDFINDYLAANPKK